MKKATNLMTKIATITLILFTIFLNNCSKDSTSQNNVIIDEFPLLSVSQNYISFESTMVSQSSASTTVSISSENLNSNIDVIVSEEFEISLNDTDFQNTISISPNTTTELFIRFSPLQTGSISGDLHIETSELDSEIIQLSGYANQLVFNYNSFNQQHLAFGSGNSQYSIQNFISKMF